MFLRSERSNKKNKHTHPSPSPTSRILPTKPPAHLRPPPIRLRRASRRRRPPQHLFSAPASRRLLPFLLDPPPSPKSRRLRPGQPPAADHLRRRRPGSPPGRDPMQVSPPCSSGRLRRRTKFTGQSWGRIRRRCVTSVNLHRRPCISPIRLSKATCALPLGHALLCASSSQATPFGSGPDPRACAAIPTASGSALAATILGLLVSVEILPFVCFNPAIDASPATG